MRLIDGDKLLARYKERCAGCKETKNYCEYCCDIADIISDIEDAPTADIVERKKGKWIHKNDKDYAGGGYEKCSCCGFRYCDWIFIEDAKYCPNCGADMRGENNGN